MKISISDLKIALTSLIITIIAGVMTNFLIVIAVVVFVAHPLFSSIASELALFIALGIIPYLAFVKLFDLRLDSVPRVRIIFDVAMYIAIGIALYRFYPLYAVLHFFVVAISEEILFRELQYTYFQKNANFIVGLIASSVIFGIVLHINDSMIVNVLLRIPLGMLLYAVRHKFGLSASVSLHWIYDVIMSFT